MDVSIEGDAVTKRFSLVHGRVRAWGRSGGCILGIVKKGSLLDGVTGRVGDLVLRVQGDKTIVSHRPRGQKTKSPTTETRQKTLTRFQSAVAFAREARHRHAYRSLSRLLGGYSPYHVALQDYLSEPTIEDVDDTRVTLEGGTLTVRAGETVAVRLVRVKMPAVEEMDPALRRSELAKDLLTTSPEHPKKPKARMPIPAALFFTKRPEDPAGPRGPGSSPEDKQSENATGTAQAADTTGNRIHSKTLDALPVGRFTGNASREERVPATRPKDVPKGVKLPVEMRVETWRVTLPRAGEIEIIVTDYAGNQTTHRTWVGPRF